MEKIEIEQLEIRHLRIPLVDYFETSFGRSDQKDGIIVIIKGEGIDGFGEVATPSDPFFSYESVKTALYVLNDYLIPAILRKKRFSGVEDLLNSLTFIKGHNMAKASLELAFLDLQAKAKNVSLSSMLGGVRQEIEVGVSVGIQKNPEVLVEKINNYRSQGYRRIKVKIKPGWDINVISLIRKQINNDLPLMVDANAAYTINDIEIFKKLDEYSLLMVEQPFVPEDLLGHAELQKKIRTPVCLDESIENYHRALIALKLGSCQIINIKPGRVGGLTEGKKIHDLCQSQGVPVWCGGMLETGIGRAHNIAISSLPNYKLPADISASKRYFIEDIIEPEVEITSRSTIQVPQKPGIGYGVKKDRIEKYTISKAVYS
jgi:O-succinylbenzoate synthase